MNLIVRGVAVVSIFACLASGPVVAGACGSMTKVDKTKKVKVEKCGCGKPIGSCKECKNKKTAKMVSAGANFQCQHCKEPMSEAAAKAKGMKCCGMKMVAVKTAKATPKPH